jgi:murein DD-endopeptidase MepM/ murein hydrolase activator NlpD
MINHENKNRRVLTHNSMLPYTSRSDLFVSRGVESASTDTNGKNVAPSKGLPSNPSRPDSFSSISAYSPDLRDSGATVSMDEAQVPTPGAPPADKKNNNIEGQGATSWIKPIVATACLGLVAWFAISVVEMKGDLRAMGAKLDEAKRAGDRMESNQTGLSKKIDDGQTALSKKISSVVGLIIALHKKNPPDKDIIIDRLGPLAANAAPNEALALSASSLWHLPLKEKNLSVEPGHNQGTIAINVMDKKPDDLVTVVAARDGTVSKLSHSIEPLRFNKPKGPKDDFITIEIRHDDDTVMMYARLAPKELIKVGDAVVAGQPIGQSKAFSPVCLRVCLKLSENDMCSDPTALFPKLPQAPRRLRKQEFVPTSLHLP